MKKKTNNKDQSDDEQRIFCVFCPNKAEFRCGNCLEAVYCSPEHQKADWGTHKRVCFRPEDKLKKLYNSLQLEKKEFFAKLSKNNKVECETICIEIRKICREIVEKFPSPMHEIEYGTAVCCEVKMLFAVKSFNEAQQNLNNYMREKNSFLRDTSNIPSKIKIEDPQYKQILLFVEGKLKLLSVLCNLTHQIVRDSVNVIEILLEHCIAFYGQNSIEVSNVYFELANYYNFLNQQNKACGCYLIAGRIRKEKGTISYYNAAILLMRNHNYLKAIRFLTMCLDLIRKHGDVHGIIDQIYLALAVCYKKLNHFDFTVEYLEKTLCQINMKHKIKNHPEEKFIRQLLRMLSDEFKKQFNNDQILSLPREVNREQDIEIVISHNNFEDYWELNADNLKKKREQQWLKSFKHETDKLKYESKVPMTNPLVEKVLFVNHFTDDKNEEALTNNKSPIEGTDQINVDLDFMTNLTATEVRFLNELNKILSLNKEKIAVYDIVENSNFVQQISKQKIERFYELNPELIREKQAYNLMGEEDESPPTPSPVPEEKPPVQKPKPVVVTKLDLGKITKNT